jgi:RNA polymerase primary sigma factor
MSHGASSWFHRLKTRGQTQGFLTYADVNDSLPAEIVHPVEIEQVVELLRVAGIRIVQDSTATPI